MKIVIIGAGAVGGLLGALLTASGEDVTMVHYRPDIIDLVNKGGQTVDVLKSAETIHVKSKMIHTKYIASLKDIELVICCTKGFSTLVALQSIKPIIGKDTYVLSVQNGWGNVEQIKDVLGSDDSHIIAGVFLSLVCPKEGKLNHLVWLRGNDVIRAGPVNKKVTPDVKNIAKTFNNAKLNFTIVENYVDAIWNKLIGNTTMPVAAILRMSNDEVMAYDATRQLVTDVLKESITVVTAMGIKLDNPANPIQPYLQTLENFKTSAKGLKGSMQLDIENGRRTEIDIINGAIVTEGKKRGIPTPINETLALFIKAMEEKSAATSHQTYHH